MVSVAVVLLLSGGRKGFCLVTVYEANTHATAGGPPGVSGSGGREATVNGQSLLLRSLPAALGLSRLGVLRETYYAGQGSSVFRCSILGTSRMKIGGPQGASVFDDNLVISAGTDGKVDLAFLGWKKTLLPNEGASFIASRNQDGRLVQDDQQLSQGQIDRLLDAGSPVSRLIVYNHGLFTKSQVKLVSP